VFVSIIACRFPIYRLLSVAPFCWICPNMSVKLAGIARRS
jgi:hypothetical protein